jgi:hypothetical protein
MKTMLITLYVTDDQLTVASIQVPVGQQAAALEAPGSTRLPQPEATQAPSETTAASTATATRSATTERTE